MYNWTGELEYEWDEAKRESNLAKHEVDFSIVEGFDWETAKSKQSDRRGESRKAATGFIGDRLYRVIFTERGDRIRVISLRKANPREVREYERSEE